jgi:acetylornithine deacetylase
VISGGDWPSTVAAACTLSCRIGLYPGQDPEETRAQVETAVAEAAAADPRLAEYPPRVRYDGFSCEGAVVDRDEPVVTTLSEAYARVHGERPPAVATTATTDARHFVRAGIPAVCFGPRGERIHGIDERVSLRSVIESAQVLGLFIRNWCGLVRGSGRREEN